MSAGDPGVAAYEEAQGPVDGARDPDPGTDRDLAGVYRLPFEDQERRPVQRMAILPPRDPHRRGELARTVGEGAIGAIVAAAPAHGIQPLEGLDCPDEHGGRVPLRAGDDVQAPVHAVDPVDVGDPRRPEHRLVARRAADALRRVRRRVVRPDVRLGFDDAPRRRCTAEGRNQNGAEEVACDLLGGSIVETPRKRSASGPAGHQSPPASTFVPRLRPPRRPRERDRLDLLAAGASPPEPVSASGAGATASDAAAFLDAPALRAELLPLLAPAFGDDFACAARAEGFAAAAASDRFFAAGVSATATT